MTNNNHPEARELLNRYHTGKCTPEELIILESWYGSIGSSEQFTAAETENYRLQFISHFRNDLLTSKKVYWLHHRITKWMAAACIVLLAGLGYLWLNKPLQQVAVAKVYMFNNESGHVKRIVLSDSSVVWLNAHASLSWKEDFNQTLRHVELNGEGFFDIHRNTARPFTIGTHDLNIAVLGTSFNVEAYQQEDLTRVTLSKGRVRISAVADSSFQTILHPGQAASLVKGKPLQVDETDAAMVSSWTAGGFVIKDLSLANALERLCQKNGYGIIWKNSKDSQKKISLSFTRESFEQILADLCYISHKQFKIINDQVTIY